MELTEKELKNLDWITDNEVNQDLIDTEREVKDFQDELEVLKRNPQANRVRIYILEGIISSHNELIEKLNQLLKFRKTSE